MEKMFQLIRKARQSKIHLWLLNRIMNHNVRFNKPHGFQVVKITDEHVQTFAPYHKKNFNHVRGIHACAIATIGELAAGMALMFHFSPLDYRVILSSLAVDYHYQAKKDIVGTAKLSPAEKEEISKKLEIDGKTLHTVITEIKDADHEVVAMVKST